MWFLSQLSAVGNIFSTENETSNAENEDSDSVSSLPSKRRTLEENGTNDRNTDDPSTPPKRRKLNKQIEVKKKQKQDFDDIGELAKKCSDILQDIRFFSKEYLSLLKVLSGNLEISILDQKSVNEKVVKKIGEYWTTYVDFARLTDLELEFYSKLSLEFSLGDIRCKNMGV